VALVTGGGRSKLIFQGVAASLEMGLAFCRGVRLGGVIRPDLPSTDAVEGREPEALDPSREAAHIRFLLMRKTPRG
jgi:hypothetical protein